jgi:hypothetical protein
MHLPRLALLLAFFLSAGPPAAVSAAGVSRRPGPYVRPCVGVALSASYLGDVSGRGPGFLFRIENRSPRRIRLEEPVPSSAHWYAQVGNRWLWRASAGWGGSLVNAENPRGLMFAYQPVAPLVHPEYLTVPAHGSIQWTEAMRDHPSIDYQPSCPMCRYRGETVYQAVFAYAYLPAPGEHVPDLLRCGLRSAPVPMPPHSAGVGR